MFLNYNLIILSLFLPRFFLLQVGRFLDVLDVMFPKKFTDVRKWKCYHACNQKQVLTNDCGFLAMKYIQFWDGKVFVKKVCPVSACTFAFFL